MVSVILLELRNKTITKIRKKEQDLNNNSLNSQPKLAFKPSNAPVAFLIAAALFFCYIAIVPYKPQNSYSLMLLALCICAVMASLIENLSDPRPRPMHLLFCIYMIFYYLFPGYLHTFYGRFPFFDAGFRPDEILSAAVAVSIFLSGVIIGYGVSFPRLLGSPRQVAPDRLILVCVGCAGAAAVSAAILGPSALLATRGDDTGGGPASPVQLIIGAIAHSASFYALLFAIFAFRRERSLGGMLLILATAGLFLLCNSPLSIPRFILGSYIIVALLVFTSFNRIYKLALAVALVAAQGTLFSFLSYIARGTPGTTFDFSIIDYYVKSLDLDGFQSTINIIKLHDDIGGKMGVNLLSALLFFVPKDIWPTKSPGTGVEAGIHAAYPFTNLSAPLPSEFYIDFGYSGVVILSLLFGMLVRACDESFQHFKKTGDIVGQVLTATAAGYVFIILRGTLVGVMGPIALSLGLAAICHRFATTPKDL